MFVFLPTVLRAHTSIPFFYSKCSLNTICRVVLNYSEAGTGSAKVIFKILKRRMYLRSVFLLPALLACICKLSFETTTPQNLIFLFERKMERPLVDHPTLEAGTFGKNPTCVVIEHWQNCKHRQYQWKPRLYERWPGTLHTDVPPIVFSNPAQVRAFCPSSRKGKKPSPFSLNIYAPVTAIIGPV